MIDNIIIGLVGEIASGKDTVADYLSQKYNSQTISFSHPLRQILCLLGLAQTRENMVWLGVDLRERFGQDILAQAVYQVMQKSEKRLFCLPNIRLPGDVSFFQTIPGFVLVNIEADTIKRFLRLRTRSQNADDANKTWEQFMADANLPTELPIREIAKQARFLIRNDTCIHYLFQQVDNILEKIRKE